MRKYTLQAWNDGPYGMDAVVLVKVVAKDEAAAIELARAEAGRTHYKLVQIEVLDGVKVSTEIRKG